MFSMTKKNTIVLKVAALFGCSFLKHGVLLLWKKVSAMVLCCAWLEKSALAATKIYSSVDILVDLKLVQLLSSC